MNYRKLSKIKKLYFGYEEIARALGITLDSARVTSSRFVNYGFLARIKRNIYVLKERWDNLDAEEKLSFANLLQVPSYISLMSALSYYQITTAIQRDFIESVCIKRTAEYHVHETTFTYTKIKKDLYFGFFKRKNLFIAEPEKAFLDAVYLESSKKYQLDYTSIDTSKLNKPKVKKFIKQFPKKTKILLEQYGYL